MLDLVKDEAERIDSRFLEPACGSGNFLVKVLQRKLAAVELRYGGYDFERRHYALLGLMCVYGIELLGDNIPESRSNLLDIVYDYLNLDSSELASDAPAHVLSRSLIHGDALTMRNVDAQAITFAEWGYLGKGRFQRRDFRFDRLTQSPDHPSDSALFASIANQEVFRPTKSYPPMTMLELASYGRSV